MALHAIDFPVDSMTATIAAVSAVTLVMAAAAPQLRNFRAAERDWRDAKTSLVHAKQKIDAVAETMAQAKDHFDSIGSVNANNAVEAFTSFRRKLTAFVDAVELATKSIEHCRARMAALRKHLAILRMAVPGIEAALDQFETATGDLSPLRNALAKIEENRIFEDLDDALEQAVDAATTFAVLRAKELAKASPDRDAARAMQRLVALYDFASAHGIKVGE